jgi:hypothetical protein
MKSRVNEWVDQFPYFHEIPATDQITLLVYFHTIEEKKESISREELQTLFRFVDVPEPDNLPQMLSYMFGKGKRLILKSPGQYSLRREVRQTVEKQLATILPSPDLAVAAPSISSGVFEFPGKTFNDSKVEILLNEAKKSYDTECWNACGILMRIVLERTLDSVDPKIKAALGLKDKLNVSISSPHLFSKTMVDALKELKNAKLIGDIVAHHSSIVLEKPDINIVAPPLRILLKEVKTV